MVEACDKGGRLKRICEGLNFYIASRLTTTEQKKSVSREAPKHSTVCMLLSASSSAMADDVIIPEFLQKKHRELDKVLEKKEEVFD